MNSSRELYGLERMIALVSNVKIKSREVGPRLLEDVHKFAGTYPQSDDMCLVCFGRE